MRLIALVSGGKDGWYSYYLMLQEGFEIPVVACFQPARSDSYMLHHPNTYLVPVQARLAGVECKSFTVSGRKEEEVEEMLLHLSGIVREYGVEGIVSGAVKSDYQKHRIDMIGQELGIATYAPLWHKPEERLLREMVEQAGIEFVVSRTAAEGLEEWAGKRVSRENLDEFTRSLEESMASRIGEGGEYETLVVGAPFFSRPLEVSLESIEADGHMVDAILRESDTPRC